MAHSFHHPNASRELEIGIPLCSEPVYFGTVAIRQEFPSFTFRLEIPQIPAGQANYIPVPTNIELSARRAVDVESLGALVRHFDFPH
jgi:hypothetical protein